MNEYLHLQHRSKKNFFVNGKTRKSKSKSVIQKREFIPYLNET